MLRKFVIWLGAVLVLLALFIVQKGHVGWVIWLLFAWAVIPTVWRVIRSRSSGPAVDADEARTPVEPENQFDPEFCGRLLRIAAFCFVAMVVIQLIFFLTVHSDKCPGWQAPREQGDSIVWALLFMAALWTLNVCYRALTWHRDSRRILDHLEWARRTYVPGTNPTQFGDPTQFRAMCAVKSDFDSILVFVLVGSGLFVALPVLTRISCF